jgi:hypothetical protein
MKFFKLALIVITSAVGVMGCSSADTETVSLALAKEKGWTKVQADCYAERLTGILDSKSYDRVAGLLSKGAYYKDALNKARRMTGKSYSNKIKNDAQLLACIK